MWLGDPGPPGNIEAMARVTHSLPIPVCTGENLYGRHGFRKLIEMQACSGVHIDVPKSGGLAARTSSMRDRRATNRTTPCLSATRSKP